MRVLALSVVAAAGLGVSVTAAADLKTGEERPASQSNRWDVAFGVEFMTDYNWRGITVSARRPAVEAYIEPRYRPAEDLELYAGVSGANVDLPNRARAQIVYYAGTRPRPYGRSDGDIRRAKRGHTDQSFRSGVELV